MWSVTKSKYKGTLYWRGGGSLAGILFLLETKEKLGCNILPLERGIIGLEYSSYWCEGGSVAVIPSYWRKAELLAERLFLLKTGGNFGCNTLFTGSLAGTYFLKYLTLHCPHI